MRLVERPDAAEVDIEIEDTIDATERFVGIDVPQPNIYNWSYHLTI